MNALEKIGGMIVLILALPFIAFAWIGFFLCNDDSRDAGADSGSGQPVLALTYESAPRQHRTAVSPSLAG